ncbi:MAG: tryptophan-rich sensory protein [Candidatus Falkowbacteria bacterium]|nr:MAG: tryptophan-rich sensory protein [Candidatus Falkowbacteria bacterium]
MNNKNIIIKAMVAVSYVAMVAVNWLANALPINNRSTGAISDAYPNLFAPAGLTFSIWGLIYLLLASYCLYQFGLFQNDRGRGKAALFQKIGLYFILSSLANIAWIFSWHYDFIGISVVLMAVILFSLIKIADILNKEKLLLKEKFFIRVPFSVYFGWITVAAIANITVFLVSINWNGFGISDQVWTIIVLLAGLLIVILRMIKDKNVAYGLVLVWAYAGILLKHLSADGFSGRYQGVIITTVLCILGFLISLATLISKKAKS